MRDACAVAVPKEGGHAGPPPSVAVHNRILVLLGQPLITTNPLKEGFNTNPLSAGLGLNSMGIDPHAA